LPGRGNRDGCPAKSTLTPALSQRERERRGTALSQRERERRGTALSQRERERRGTALSQREREARQRQSERERHRFTGG
jgi:hypothetical protein